MKGKIEKYNLTLQVEHLGDFIFIIIFNKNKK